MTTHRYTRRVSGGLAVYVALIILAACDTANPPVAAQSATRAASVYSPKVACENLARSNLTFEGNTTVTAATAVTAGSIVTSNNQRISNLPNMCRVEGVSRPTGDSDIRFEVWLPTDHWNGRFMSSGEGGLAGALNYTRNGLDGGLDEIVRRGYATASTDTGHRASDPYWAIGHPERVVDYAHRAKHLVTVAAKGLIEAYYGQPPVRSYFNSCSNGGRQALVQAQRYPQDYDGFVIGAPWNLTQRATAGFLWTARALAEPGANIPPTKLPMIRQAVMDHCDARDGLKDGLIEDPRKCGFDPGVLSCKAADAPNCLTEPQVKAMRALYQGPVNPRTGEKLYPGWAQGSESSWARMMTPNVSASYPLTLGVAYYRNIIYGDSQWDWRSFDFDRGMALADEKATLLLNAASPDLSAVRQRGVKIIFYQGWDDEVLQPENTPNYYEQVMGAMGGPAATRTFARLFMVPGMAHCYLGPGANSFGGVGQQLPPSRDATHDVQKALERWVEDGVAPQSMVATRYADERPATRRIEMQRLLCPYPAVARYKGVGNQNEASSFSCVTP